MWKEMLTVRARWKHQPTHFEGDRCRMRFLIAAQPQSYFS